MSQTFTSQRQIFQQELYNQLPKRSFGMEIQNLQQNSQQQGTNIPKRQKSVHFVSQQPLCQTFSLENTQNYTKDNSNDQQKISDEKVQTASTMDDDRMQEEPSESLNFNLEDQQFLLNFLNQSERKNPQFVGPYADEIFKYLSDNQSKYFVEPFYMENIQTQINPKMRCILVDWIIKVHHKFKFRPETLFLTVYLIDQFLSKNLILINQLQLVGITALFIASKYEEIYPPELKDFVFICDKGYTKQEILRAEGVILMAVNFDLNFTSPIKFLERYIILQNEKESQQIFQTPEYYLSLYLLELTLHDHLCLQFCPSLLAASALYLAQRILSQQNDQINSLDDEQTVKFCAYRIMQLHQSAGSFNAAQKKYSQPCFLQVASLLSYNLGSKLSKN